ncbi:MAG: ABC transporter permease [Actinobacteria bacterium]|nr:MAG: ABC transporter permease [Actinomycetota bacterium]
MTDTDLRIREAIPARPIVHDEGGSRSGRLVVIEPARRWPRLYVPELWHYRELLLTFVWRDVKVRYKQTLVGVAWALLVPMFTLVVYVVVYGRFAKFPAGHLKYPVLVIGGLLPMQYFMSSLTGSGMSIVSGSSLVSKVYFPRVLLPLAAVLTPVVDFTMSFSVMLGVMAWFHTWPSWPAALLAPAFLALALITAFGAGLFLSALNVRFRDVQYAVPVFLQVLPLLSGVPFALDRIPQKWQWILAFNPMSTVIAGWRWAMLGGTAPDPAKAAVGLAVVVLLFLGGLTFFRSSEPRFADNI